MRLLILTLLALLPALSARAAETAAGFLQRVYAPYLHGGPPSDWSDHPEKFFAPELATLIARDTALAGRRHEVGALDGDVFCDCQDGQWRYRFTTLATTATRARFRVAMHDAAAKADQAITLDVVLLPTGWRIADIHTKDTPSLQAYLQKAVAQEEAETRSDPPAQP